MPYKDKQKNRDSVKRHYYNNKEKYTLKNIEKRQKVRTYIDSLKEDAVCKDCLLPYPPYVLEFDHARGVKKRNIRNCTSWKQLNEELVKCDLVCANCHTIRTYNRQGHVAEQ